MQHLWLNILGNAVKYTLIRGEISAKVIPQEGSITIQIADTGEGMDAETQAHLFDPYYQGDVSHSGQSSIRSWFEKLSDAMVELRPPESWEKGRD